MSNSASESAQNDSSPKASFAEFLAECPPGTERCVPDFSDCVSDDSLSMIATRQLTYAIKTPDLELYCDVCEGLRTFRSLTGRIKLVLPNRHSLILEYQCGNCSEARQTFAIRVAADLGAVMEPRVLKLGQEPAFGPRTPRRLLSLLGDLGHLFQKGRRCESQGLGIAAHAYYRRVVEAKRDRIFDKVIEVAKKLGHSTDALETAKTDSQFKSSIESLGKAFPESLLIDGHNPLTMLYSRLSDGVHSLSDDECLVQATANRTVLAALAEKMDQALRDDTELKGALAALHKAGTNASQPRPRAGGPAVSDGDGEAGATGTTGR